MSTEAPKERDDIPGFRELGDKFLAVRGETHSLISRILHMNGSELDELDQKVFNQTGTTVYAVSAFSPEEAEEFENAVIRWQIGAPEKRSSHLEEMRNLLSS